MILWFYDEWEDCNSKINVANVHQPALQSPFTQVHFFSQEIPNWPGLHTQTSGDTHFPPDEQLYFKIMKGYLQQIFLQLLY